MKKRIIMVVIVAGMMMLPVGCSTRKFNIDPTPTLSELKKEDIVSYVTDGTLKTNDEVMAVPKEDIHKCCECCKKKGFLFELPDTKEEILCFVITGSIILLLLLITKIFDKESWKI